MEIQEIKNKLTLSSVLNNYHLKPDRNNRLNCPFHDDKTPSLQVYHKTNTAYCFSSNCKTHGKSLDVIDFIMHKEDCTKHEAILKAKEMITGNSKPNKTMAESSRTEVVTKIFSYFKTGLRCSQPGRDYLKSRCLDVEKTEVGYNSGQFHHGKRKEEFLIKCCVEYGLLLDLGIKARTGNVAYKPFGKWCIVFPLRNIRGQIVSLYFRSTLKDKKQRHFYLRDRQGLYPNYPKAETTKLILTESIIDAATLLEQVEIKNKYEVLSLFGTNGLTAEHQRVIKDLKKLKEIIFFLNGDQPGKKAVQKYAKLLTEEYPNVKISNIEVPENEDVNSLLQGHSAELLAHLLESRKAYDFIFSTENTLETEQEDNHLFTNEVVKEKPKEVNKIGLDSNNPYNLKFSGNEARYQIKGFKINQLDSLKITLQIIQTA